MDYPIQTVLDILDKTYPYHPMGDVTSHDPFRVLICCLLSLRSRDAITMQACTRLFKQADTPEKLLKTPKPLIERLIYPVSYYRHKAGIIQNVSRELLQHFNGTVPDLMESLLNLPGVGRKTANLVLSLGFDQPAICVDTHVHRICNRLGYVSTDTPTQTEMELRDHLPLKYWAMINRVMVRHGQEVCTAFTPHCDTCVVNSYCQKIGVKIPYREKVKQTLF